MVAIAAHSFPIVSFAHVRTNPSFFAPLCLPEVALGVAWAFRDSLAGKLLARIVAPFFDYFLGAEPNLAHDLLHPFLLNRASENWHLLVTRHVARTV